VSNEEVLSQTGSGVEVDQVALRALTQLRLQWGGSLSTVYLPSLDISRNDMAARARALSGVESFVEEQIARVENHGLVLVILAADSHPPQGGLGRMIVFDRGAARGVHVRIRSEDVAPSILARAGIPVAADLPGRPSAALFSSRSLETATVPTYGPRIATAPAPKTVTDKEYLEKLRSLGYLN
jgi:hypothetical protein